MTQSRRLNVEHSTSTAHRLYHYDGVCSNVHGHNLEWSVDLTVKVDDNHTNMSVDFKLIADILDEYDHAILLNEADPLTGVSHIIGDVVTFDGDPTCELVSQEVANKLVGAHRNITYAEVEVSETDKYAMGTSSYSSIEDDSD